MSDGNIFPEKPLMFRHIPSSPEVKNDSVTVNSPKTYSTELDLNQTDKELNELKKVYFDSGLSSVKSFETYVLDMFRKCKTRMQIDGIHKKALDFAKERFPKYVSEIRGLGDGGDVLVFYDVPFEECNELKDITRNYIDEINQEALADLLVDTRPSHHRRRLFSISV